MSNNLDLLYHTWYLLREIKKSIDFTNLNDNDMLAYAYEEDINLLYELIESRIDQIGE